MREPSMAGFKRDFTRCMVFFFFSTTPTIQCVCRISGSGRPLQPHRTAPAPARSCKITHSVMKSYTLLSRNKILRMDCYEKTKSFLFSRQQLFFFPSFYDVQHLEQLGAQLLALLIEIRPFSQAKIWCPGQIHEKHIMVITEYSRAILDERKRFVHLINNDSYSSHCDIFASTPISYFPSSP